MMKRILSILLIALLFISMLSFVCLADDSAYWTALDKYSKAVSSGDKNAILSAVKLIDKAYSSPKNATEYQRVAFPVLKAALILEEQTKFDQAISYYKKALKYITWLDTNTSASYKDHLLNLPRVIDQLNV